MTRRAPAFRFAGAALFAGAAAWALQQQVGYVAASWLCGNDLGFVLALSVAALALLLGGGWLSWRVLVPHPAPDQSDLWRPRHFLALVSLLAALLFLFTILMQAAAAFFLPGCVG